MRRFVFRGRDIGRVGFFGLGRSNLGVKKYLEDTYDGLEFTLRSDRAVPEGTGGFMRMLCGSEAFSEPYEDVLFVAPAVRRDREELAEMQRRGVILASDAELFLESTKTPIFAVSGSDGKSTTTTLASLILSHDGVRVPAIGNIGVAMSPLLNDTDIPYAVAELSSFQLMWQRPRVYRAAITNISPNHLDWHRSYEEYIAAKENLLFEAEERVFNLDCEISRELMKRHRTDTVTSCVMSPEQMEKATKADLYVGLKGDYIEANGVKILHTGAILCKTRHNISNFVTAIALTHGHADRERIEEVARTFPGLAHRCESIGCFGGVRYVNSSIDSTPKRTATTLASLDGEWIVILGGRSKGLDYRELIPQLRARARLSVLTGESGKEIGQILREAGVACTYEADFDAAAELAVRNARPGEGVILSPASTSFDRFSSFEERGEYFKYIIRKLHNKDKEK